MSVEGISISHEHKHIFSHKLVVNEHYLYVHICNNFKSLKNMSNDQSRINSLDNVKEKFKKGKEGVYLQ